MDRVEDRAVDVVLALIEGAVADSDRTGARVTTQMVEGRLGQVPSPIYAVHDLERTVVVWDQVGDELHELIGLPIQVQPVESLKGEGGVAHPGVAVIPVALAARS